VSSPLPCCARLLVSSSGVLFDGGHVCAFLCVRGCGHSNRKEHIADGDARAAFAQDLLGQAQPKAKKKSNARAAAAATAAAEGGVAELVDEAKADLHDWLAADTVPLSEEDMVDARYEAEVEDMADDLAQILAMNDDGGDDEEDDDDWDIQPLAGRMHGVVRGAVSRCCVQVWWFR